MSDPGASPKPDRSSPENKGGAGEIDVFWRVGGGRRFDLSKKGLVMGILNTTPDSFSDGGLFSNLDHAVAHGLAMEAEGAAIIDVGGESTRPGAAEVSAEDELNRVVPVIRRLAEALGSNTLISVDTSKARVAEAALEAGAAIINDVTGLLGDVRMLEVAANCDAGLVIMHMKGTPRTMQAAPDYADVVTEVREYFKKSLERCTSARIDPGRICFDPGIGFGKTVEHNLALLRGIGDLRVGNRPLLVGVSRKSFIAKLAGDDSFSARSWGTVALTAHTRESGAEIHRVHEVRPNIEAMRMAEAIAFG